MVKITSVEAHSRAEKAGICVGDELVSLNGHEIRDVLDYRFYLAERNIVLVLLRGGEEHTISFHKGEYDDIGLGFETPLMDKKRACRNKCIFCFIDQLPEGLREPLYFKDDDSRLSFLHGNYVTLTNMEDRDVERIIAMHISPINVSVHTTNPELRVKMMKNRRAGEVLSYLSRFKEAGIALCGQIVLCKGWNDGEELLRTMRDLRGLYPEMGSVSIVPAGLTRFREGLTALEGFTKEECREVIACVTAFGDECKETLGSRIFFAADEFYVKGEAALPSDEFYEGYPQIENGVGMLTSFMTEFGLGLEDIAALSEEVKLPRRVSVATGVAAYDRINAMARRLEGAFPGLEIAVYRIVNRFFGESITVAGLLTGKDMAEQLLGKDLGDRLYIPSSTLRAEGDLFLCGMTPDELSARLSVPVTPAPNEGDAWVRALLGLTPRY